MDSETDPGSTIPRLLDRLRGCQLLIPDLRPAFATWKQGVNPLHGKVKQAVDARLEGLIDDDKALAKVKAADLGLFASGLFPDATYHVLETAGFYCVWLFLWDDAIDSAAATTTTTTSSAAAGVVAPGEVLVVAPDEYCRESVAFVQYHIGLQVGEPEPKAPTKVCESFAEVAGRVAAEFCRGEADKRELFRHLKDYMEGCLAEYRGMKLGRMPTVDEFYSWRLRTSSVDAMLCLCRILNGISLPSDVLDSEALKVMGLKVNKLLILINELFSLKKELKDGASTNLIPIIMWESDLDLERAVQQVVQDIYDCAREFDSHASSLQALVAKEHGAGVADQLRRLIEAYQAIATSVLNFSVQSPRYGLLKDRRDDGSFLVDL